MAKPIVQPGQKLHMGTIYEILDRGKVVRCFRPDKFNERTGRYAGPAMERSGDGFVESGGRIRLSPARTACRPVR